MRSAARAATVCSALACDVYHAPPEPSLPQANGGLLADPAAPVVVAFDKPVDPSSLTLEIARDIVDDRGRLADEADPNANLSLLFSHDPAQGDWGGAGSLSADGMTYTITPSDALPLSPALVLIVEPGLRDTTYEVPTRARRKLVFSYQLDLSCTKPSAVFPADASYFILIDVKQPVGTQVKLFARFKVAQDGQFSAAFISAVRNPDPNRCSPPCATTDACRTLPGPEACVAPSTRADSTDEFPDFIANVAPATTFSFVTQGCVVDQADGSALFVNAPVDVFVTSPAVTLRNTKLTASFAVDAQGVLRGAGALTADDVLLGTASSGQGSGSLAARVLPADQVPPNIPVPP